MHDMRFAPLTECRPGVAGPSRQLLHSGRVVVNEATSTVALRPASICHVAAKMRRL